MAQAFGQLEELLSRPVGGPRVVAIGGGHGMAQVLEAVQSYAGQLSAIVTVADDGGSSGRLTSGNELPPPGDIRRCLIALSPAPSMWRELFEFRFDEADVAGHSLGNLILFALNSMIGDFETAVRTAQMMLEAQGDVIPAAPKRVELEAIIDGRVVRGQAAITKASGSFSRLRLDPDDVKATPSALDAIAAADQIVIGPGSLYTSVLSTLLVPGIADAVNRASGRLVFVLNLITQNGETLGMRGSDHVKALQELGGLERAGTVLANATELEVVAPLEAVEIDSELLGSGWGFHLDDLVDHQARWPQHDPIRLGSALDHLASGGRP